MEEFVNLRVHSSYSIKEGLLSPEQIVDIAAANGEKAVAITDINYMLKAVDFYEYARKKGVKPIIGVDAFIERDIFHPNEFDDQNIENFEPTRILLLAKNEAGYKEINTLLSKAHIENQKEALKDYDGVGFIKQSWLTPETTKNIIALSGDFQTGDIVREMTYGDQNLAIEKAKFYQQAFGNEFFLEIQRYEQADEELSVLNNLKVSQATGIPVVATHPVQFKDRTDYYYHEIRSCISSMEEVIDINRVSRFTREQYYKNNAEINETFKDLPMAVKNSSIIADMCNAKLRLNVNDLPQFPTGDKTTEEFLNYTSHEGLKQRMIDNFPDVAEREANMQKYVERLDWELDTINKMGFPGYFLIVYDFIRWAKENDIYVGPGRGSGAGSLVAYSLGITDLDPLPYNLLFERFLNPERVSMPDFDIDFESVRRPEVIDYVHKKYDGQSGNLSVSQIATYGLLKAKSVIKAVSRALQIPYVVSDQISKKLPNDPKLKLSDVLAYDWVIEAMATDSKTKELMDACKALENIPTSIGVHAGGVVIGKTNLVDYTPLSRADMSSTIFSQYDKNEVEKAGLVKFDFLALSNLTVLQKAIQSINKREEFEKKPFQLKNIPLDDQDVFKLFKEGNSVAVFQFEGQGMQNTLKLVSPDKFEDLIAIVSLFRPGPMAYIPEYVNNKKTGNFNYPHESLDEILGETYGIMIYQEQVMQVAQKIAGYSLGQADMLRRAMGKKKASEMEKHRSIFRDGAEKNGIPNDQADEIFDIMEKFANYGFNKSHAAAYSLISYQTAYLKTHYTAEYLTAFLNVEAMEKASKNSVKVEVLLNDARNNGLSILPPDINKCNTEFTFEGKEIRFGLSGIKGISPAAIEEIKENLSEKGEFKSFTEFYERIGFKSKKTVIENLIYAGVFDRIETDRARLINSIPLCLAYKDVINYNKKNSLINEERKLIQDFYAENQAEIDALNVQIKALNKTGTDQEKMEFSKEVAKLIPDYTFVVNEDPTKKSRLKVLKAPSFLKIKELEPIQLPTDFEPWDSVAKYNYEKSVYGFYLTGHPYNYYNRELSGFKSTFPLDEIDLMDVQPEGEMKLVSGIVHSLEKKKSKNGNLMGILTLGDGKNIYTTFVFERVLEKHADKLKVGEFISFQAKIVPPKTDGKKNLISIEDVFNFAEIKDKLVKGVSIATESINNEKLVNVISKHRGPMQVTLYNPENKTGNYAVVELDPSKYGVNASPECIKELEDTFGKDKMKLNFHDKIIFQNNYKHRLRY